MWKGCGGRARRKVEGQVGRIGSMRESNAELKEFRKVRIPLRRSPPLSMSSCSMNSFVDEFDGFTCRAAWASTIRRHQGAMAKLRGLGGRGGTGDCTACQSRRVRGMHLIGWQNTWERAPGVPATPSPP